MLKMADTCLKFAQRANHTAVTGTDDHNKQH